MTSRLAVTGASGRVGSAVVRLAESRGFRVVKALSRSRAGEDLSAVVAGVKPGVTVEASSSALASGGYDVAIDFSSDAAVPGVAAAVARGRAALVSGTTGLGQASEAALDAAAREVPVLWEPNMSVAVHVLGRLVRDAVVALGEEFDVEIVETHHGKKVDAPSGTALRLAAMVRAGDAARATLRHGREGRPGPRAKGEIGVHAVRGGDVIGDHAVHLLGQGERIELVHRATHRDLFALGALRAAAWLVGKPPGRYTLSDVLG